MPNRLDDNNLNAEINQEYFDSLISRFQDSIYAANPFADPLNNYVDSRVYIDDRSYYHNHPVYPRFKNEETSIQLSREELEEILSGIRCSCGGRLSNGERNALIQKLLHSLRECEINRPATQDEIMSAYNLIDSVLQSGRNRVQIYTNCFKPKLYEYIVNTLSSFGVTVEPYSFDHLREYLFDDKPKYKLGFFND